MADTAANPEAIIGIYKDAHEVARLSEERFEVSQQIEELDTEDPQVIEILDTLGQLSTPNLARLSVGERTVSSGAEELVATQAFLNKRRAVAQEGRSFTAAEMAGLALPMYLARKDEAAEDAAGSEPITVSKRSRALAAAITAHDRNGDYSVSEPVTGTVNTADTKAGVLELTPEGEGLPEGAIYRVEPLRTAGKYAGQVQVAIEAAATQQ